MAKRFLIVLALILAFFAVWSVLLLLFIVIAGNNDSAMMLGILVAMALIFITFIPWFNYAIKKAFTFRGEGKAVSAETLKQEIESINQYDAPVMVKRKGDKLIVTWRYVDAKWWEIMAKAGLKKMYELHIKFDDKHKVAKLIDFQKSVSWRVGAPGQVSLSGGFTRGVVFEYEIGKAWGIRENFTPGKIYDYTFTPGEIKNPIMNTILRHGWTVQFAMW
jgi:hypothetical protein